MPILVLWWWRWWVGAVVDCNVDVYVLFFVFLGCHHEDGEDYPCDKSVNDAVDDSNDQCESVCANYCILVSVDFCVWECKVIDGLSGGIAMLPMVAKTKMANTTRNTIAPFRLFHTLISAYSVAEHISFVSTADSRPYLASKNF
jgi:hypothetical protein